MHHLTMTANYKVKLKVNIKPFCHNSTKITKTVLSFTATSKGIQKYH